MNEPMDDDMVKVTEQYLYKWSYFYTETQEMVPWNILEVIGKSVVIKSYVYDNHMENM